MNVRELLDDPALALTLAVRGDLDSPIAWVHAIDRFPASEFLSGGEVALTSGQWWPAVSAEDYVADLAKAGVLALGFGITNQLTDLPSQLISACERHSLTLFLVPIEVPFIEVIKAFVNAQRRIWERPLRRHLDYHERFVEALREDRSLGAMLETLAAGLGGAVGVVADRETYGVESTDGMHPLPLLSENTVDAALFSAIDPATFGVEQIAAVSVAAPFIALEIERIRSIRRTVDSYTRELFTWLRSGEHDAVSVIARIQSLGLPAEDRLAIAAVDHPDPDEVLLTVRRTAGERVAVAARLDDVVLVCIEGVDAVERFAEALPRAASAGFGTPGDAEHLHLSLIQAEHALSLARRMGRGAVVHADELNSPSTVLLSQASELIRETAAALLAPLREYDATRGGQLLHTLEVFLQTGGRWSVAATELYIHPNTLRHRVQLIEQITGRSLDATRDRTDFDLALALAADRGR